MQEKNPAKNDSLPLLSKRGSLPLLPRRAAYPKKKKKKKGKEEVSSLISILTLVQHKNALFDKKYMVRHKNALIDTKIHGSTQKCPVRHKNALPSMHQLPLPLSNTPSSDKDFFQLCSNILFLRTRWEMKLKLYGYSNIFDIIMKHEM